MNEQCVEWDQKSFRRWLQDVKGFSPATTSDISKGFRRACTLLAVQTYYNGMLEDLPLKVRDFDLIENASKIKRGVRMAAEFVGRH